MRRKPESRPTKGRSYSTRPVMMKPTSIMKRTEGFSHHARKVGSPIPFGVGRSGWEPASATSR